MERKILDAGKKAAEDLAPDPIKHTPEAPIISEDEAQVIESPGSSGPDAGDDQHLPDDIRRRQAGYDNKANSGGIRITPED